MIKSNGKEDRTWSISILANDCTQADVVKMYDVRGNETTDITEVAEVETGTDVQMLEAGDVLICMVETD